MKAKHLHGDYYVHSNGTVTKGSKTLKQSYNSIDGIARVSIKNPNGRHRNEAVNRLVANAFIPNPNKQPCAFNVDFDKTNNSVSNLEWISKGESARRNKEHKLGARYTPPIWMNIATSMPWRQPACTGAA